MTVHELDVLEAAPEIPICFGPSFYTWEQLGGKAEKYMQEQQSLFHEQWKVRYLTRRLKAIDPEYAVTEEELDRQIHEKEN